MNLTPKQLDMLVLIRRYRHDSGVAPTLDELAESAGISKVTVREHLVALRSKGALWWEPHRARSIRLVGDESDTVALQDVIRQAVDTLRSKGCGPLAGRLERLVAMSVPRPMSAH